MVFQVIALLDDPILDPDIQSLAYGAIGKMVRHFPAHFPPF